MLVSDAIKAAGYEGKVKIAMDCAATEFYGEAGRSGAGLAGGLDGLLDGPGPLDGGLLTPCSQGEAAR